MHAATNVSPSLPLAMLSAHFLCWPQIWYVKNYNSFPNVMIKQILDQDHPQCLHYFLSLCLPTSIMICNLQQMLRKLPDKTNHQEVYGYHCTTQPSLLLLLHVHHPSVVNVPIQHKRHGTVSFNTPSRNTRVDTSYEWWGVACGGRVGRATIRYLHIICKIIDMTEFTTLFRVITLWLLYVVTTPRIWV